MIGRSWIRPAAVALGAALALGVVFAADARGAPADGGSGGGGLGPGWVVATASDLGAGTFPGAGLPAVAPPAASPYSWSRAVTGAVCVVLAGPVPPALAGELSPLPGMVLFPGVPVHMGAVLGAPSGAVRWEHAATVPAGAHVVGPLVFDVATPTDPARDIEVLPRCLGAGEPLPPGVPTAAEVWQATPLPRATVHADPPGTRPWPGITGMESRLWGSALPDARATVTLDGYVVDVVAHPVAYAFVVGGRVAALGPTPGDAGAPPVRFRPTRRGDTDVVEYVVWHGLAHVYAPAWGLDFGVQDLGTVTVPERAPYHVAEIRALLRSRGLGS